MSRLTDTQLIILSAASQRDDRGVELPANIKGEAARKAVDKLIRAGLLEEVRATGSLPVWRHDDDSGPMALRITKNGLDAIDVEDEAVAAPKKTSARPDAVPAKPKDLQPRPSPPASRLRLQRKRPLVSSISPARRRPKPIPCRKAGRARNKLACSRCWADRRERRLPPSCARPIGSSTRSAASLPAWCARSLALICARRKPTGTGSIVSSTAAVHDLIPAVRVVAQLERHATRTDRSGGAGSSVARQRDRASARSRCRGTPRQMAHGVPAARAPSPAPPPAVSDSGLPAASRSARRTGCRLPASA